MEPELGTGRFAEGATYLVEPAREALRSGGSIVDNY
jgi:hypothetical protein